MIMFTEEMKTGVLLIDSQHRSMIEFANTASTLSTENPSKEKMKDCLDFLGNYVVRHFNDEEKLQIESKYPRYRQHKEIHEEFKGTFQSLYAEFMQNGPSEALSCALTSRVSNWIVTHIRMEDVTFGEYYKKAKLEHLRTYIPN